MGTDDQAEEVADRVYAMLESMGAYGQARARRQEEVARAVGISARQLQDATLALNLRGVPVLSSCGRKTLGIYIAQSVEEIGAYAEQLKSRLTGLARRMAAVNRIARQWAAVGAVEPDGQRRLFA